MVRKMDATIKKCYNAKKEVEGDPITWIQSEYTRMNGLMKHLTDLKPDFIEEYIQDLLKRIKKEIKSLEKKDGYYDFPEIKEKYDYLDNYPQLRKLIREFYLLHLNPMKKSPNDPEKYLVWGLNESKSFRRMSYYRVKSLTELLGKEKGIEVYTTILTRMIDEAKKKNPESSDITVTSRINKAVKAWCSIGMADFVYCNLDEHMTIFRFDSCFAHEALKEYNDPDIAYIASCYGADLPVFNEGRNIRLLRTQTLHHADFCDEFYWDQRVHDNPKMPSIDFVEKMGKE